ncbi:DNA-processing protein DprA [Pseudoflavonifractor phocaeensis]|uniref:DNA-processing protein DprA n=1 Tax=Pseudoflavonifractor phocaeensis TaxID=1870988 RepID=UPI001F429946|nr:DNA-protecting protein DprA [Pseudoflavonifractor phocaeensis]
MSALKYWIWLASRRGLGAAGALTVLDYFVTPERAYYADREEYDMLPLHPSQRRDLEDKSLDRAERILGDCERLGLRIMTFQDADYPQRLRALADPPAVLYIRGRTFHFDEEAAIGVVGARSPSTYGEKWAERFGLELASGGALVVSGIAEGVDCCAIKGALKAGGPVVSVLAGGIDVPYPAKHRYLYEDVAAAGALISEYPPGTLNQGHHFPWRNRILSGLCLGVLAVECRPFGGTMSTARHALDQDRDLFAVPGALDAPMSEGTNLLIQQGAKLVTCGRDILEEYWDRFPEKLKSSAPLTPEAARERLEDLRQQQKERPAPKSQAPQAAPDPAPARETVPREEQKRRFTDDQLALLAALSGETRATDQLVELTQIPARRVLSALTMLQIQGVVEEHPGKRFSALVELEE